MGIEVQKSGDTLLIKVEDNSLSGEIANEFKATVIKHIDSGVKKIQLDLGNTNFIDSSGIGKLLFINKKLGLVGGVIEIIKITDTLYEFLDSLTITRVINIKK